MSYVEGDKKPLSKKRIFFPSLLPKRGKSLEKYRGEEVPDKL